MIVVAGQRPGADRDALVGRVGGAVQMVDGEPQCLLRGRVAIDLDVAALPAACPGRLVRRDHAAPAELSRNVELVPRLAAGIRILGVAPHHGDGALETHDLPGAGFPAPGPFQLAERGRRKIAAVDLQRRCGRHGEALAGTLGAPHAEILIEPFGDEPEFTPSNDASSVISTSPSSISNWISCSPIARSLSDTRRNVRRRMPSVGRLRHGGIR